MAQAGGKAATFKAPNATTTFESSNSTQQSPQKSEENTPPQLPQPEQVQPAPSSAKSTKKRRKSSLSSSSIGDSPYPTLAKTPDTQQKRAKAIFNDIEKGKDVSVERRRTILGAALSSFISRNEKEALKSALEQGADPNVNKPVTPLYTAVDLDNKEAVELLLHHNASLVTKNDGDGECALQLAMKRGPSTRTYNVIRNRIQLLESWAVDIERQQLGENDEDAGTPLRAAKRQRIN